MLCKSWALPSARTLDAFLTDFVPNATKKPPPLVLTASELSLGLKSPETPNQGFRKAKTGDLPPLDGGSDGPDAPRKAKTGDLPPFDGGPDRKAKADDLPPLDGGLDGPDAPRKAKTGDLPPFEGGPDGPDASEARDAEGAEAPAATPPSSAREVVHLQKTGSDYIDRGDEPDAARRRGMI